MFFQIVCIKSRFNISQLALTFLMTSTYLVNIQIFGLILPSLNCLIHFYKRCLHKLCSFRNTIHPKCSPILCQQFFFGFFITIFIKTLQLFIIYKINNLLHHTLLFCGDQNYMFWRCRPLWWSTSYHWMVSMMFS